MELETIINEASLFSHVDIDELKTIKSNNDIYIVSPGKCKLSNYIEKAPLTIHQILD